MGFVGCGYRREANAAARMRTARRMRNGRVVMGLRVRIPGEGRCGGRRRTFWTLVGGGGVHP